jgi:hypothetical protein
MAELQLAGLLDAGVTAQRSHDLGRVGVVDGDRADRNVRLIRVHQRLAVPP